jgi:hypothetical protein
MRGNAIRLCAANFAPGALISVVAKLSREGTLVSIESARLISNRDRERIAEAAGGAVVFDD